MSWTDDELTQGLQALLFVAGDPVPARELAAALEAPLADVERLLRAMRADLEGAGLELQAIGGAWQLRTAPRFAEAVLKLRGGRPTRLSAAALEVLAVVAYRQPATRQEVEDLRGVESGRVIKQLVDRDLLRAAGRRDEPGKPLEYRTTTAFLELFGLNSLDALPTLAERAALTGEETPRLDASPNAE